MADRLGQQFGDYRLLRWLGGGNFGDVYLGEHVREHTPAAVKVLQARLTTSGDLKEFIREARTMRLKHPHIVQLLDFDITADNTPFLVMDYASNGTLRQRHPKGTRLPLALVSTYVTQIAAALQYAHERGLVHRDVKPENMLLGPHNELWLSDFGIASVAHSSPSLYAQDPAGTVPYMAPEQLAGKPRPASDQYALRVVVYEWLCGSRPFNGTAIEIAMQQTLTPPPPLREKVPTLPPAVEEVVIRALAKAPQQRFGSVQAFAEALEQASQGGSFPSTVQPMPQPPLQRPARIPPSLRQVDQSEPSLAPPPSLRLSPSEAAMYVRPPAKVEADPLRPASSAPPANRPRRSTPSSPQRAISPVARRKALSHRKGALFVGLALLVVLLSSTWILYPIVINDLAANAYANAVAANGTMFGFDAQHTHSNPYEKAVSPLNVSGLRKAWAFQTGDAINTSSPAVAGGVVYVGSADHSLYAIDATTGAKKWTFQTGSSIFSSPAIVNGMVYVGSTDNSLYAIDAATGEQKWAFQTTRLIDSTPAVANGVVYVGSNDHSLYAFALKGG